MTPKKANTLREHMNNLSEAFSFAENLSDRLAPFSNFVEKQQELYSMINSLSIFPLTELYEEAWFIDATEAKTEISFVEVERKVKTSIEKKNDENFIESEILEEIEITNPNLTRESMVKVLKKVAKLLQNIDGISVVIPMDKWEIHQVLLMKKMSKNDLAKLNSFAHERLFFGSGEFTTHWGRVVEWTKAVRFHIDKPEHLNID